MGRATSNFFGAAPWGPGEGSKGQISFNFNYKVNFKDFYTKLCVCLLTNERYKTYQTGFHYVAWVMTQWSDFGALGVPRGSKKFVFKDGHVAYQIDRDHKQNRMQVKFSS